MFRIGEFSGLSKVSVRMLRYYDETGLLRPAQVDPATGYRLYDAEQLPALQKIVLLRDLGFGVAEIADALESWDNRIIDRLEQKKSRLKSDLLERQERIRRLDEVIRDARSRNLDTHYHIALKSAPALLLLSLRRVIPRYDCEGTLWEELLSFIRRERIAVSNQNLVIFHDEIPRDDGVDAEAGFVVHKPVRVRGEFVCREAPPVPQMACFMVPGPFSNIGPAYCDFARWLDARKYFRMNGPTRQICHRGPYNEDRSENFLTEVLVPVCKSDRAGLDSDTV